MLSGGAYEKRDYDKNSNILLFLYIFNLNHNTFVLLAFFPVLDTIAVAIAYIKPSEMWLKLRAMSALV